MSDEATVVAALRVRHPDQMGEWAFLSGVSDRTGGATRICDALAMNLWESRGLALHGYEVKCSRSDWLSELRNPAKADRFWKWCRYWTIAVPSADLTKPGRGAETVKWERQTIVAEGELPDGWGLSVWNGKKWHNPVKAKSHPTEDIPRRLVAAMLRRAVQGSALETELRTAKAQGYQEGLDAQGRNSRVDRLQRGVDEERAQRKALEDAVGVPLVEFVDRYRTRWAGTTVEERAAALNALLAGPQATAATVERLAHSRNMARALTRAIDKIIEQSGVEVP